MAQSTIAIVCDCDDTLAPDTTNFLLEQNGVDTAAFWSEHKSMVASGWDPPIAWMTMILGMIRSGRVAQGTNAALRELGGRVRPNRGAESLAPRVKKMVASNPDFADAGISAEFYIISSGFEEIIRGTPFAGTFDDVFGGTFAEDNGRISAIKSAVTFTEKTKFLHAINKGIKGSRLRKNPYLVNDYKEPDERRIPFSNMIYIGDSKSDVPCFSAVNNNGGQSIGIAGDPTFRTGHALALDRRTTAGPYRGNYDEGGDLMGAINASVMNIAYRMVSDTMRSPR